jgi:hypothetical protein
VGHQLRLGNSTQTGSDQYFERMAPLGTKGIRIPRSCRTTLEGFSSYFVAAFQQFPRVRGARLAYPYLFLRTPNGRHP